MAEIKWIPCKKKLPDESGNYLVTFEYFPISQDISVGERHVTTWFFTKDGGGFGFGINVIAWSKLPDPYDEKEETIDG